MQLVILDRDGVINLDSDAFIKTPEEWIPIPGSLEAIARLCRAEYRVVVATNQSGIARGLYSMDMLSRIHARMLRQIQQKGGAIDAIMFCPHADQDGCECRKPKPGMLLELAERSKITLTGVPAVGDSIRDLEAAAAAGARPVLVRTGNGRNAERILKDGHRLNGISVYPDLSTFVDELLSSRTDEAPKPAG